MTSKTTGNPPWRPTVMTEEMQTEICWRLAGGESLNSICKDDNMPAMSTVTLAVVQNRGGFSAKYMEARTAAGFVHADRVLGVVNKLEEDPEFNPIAARAMLDGLKWAAERMSSRAHSARQEVDLSSTDGTMAAQLDPSKLSKETLKELLNAASETVKG